MLQTNIQFYCHQFEGYEMSENLQWLRDKAPGFGALSEEERDAFIEFAFLWSLFESRILDARASAAKIVEVTKAWCGSGELDVLICEDELAYFRKRYFSDGNFTYHFGQLNFRRPDREALVKQVINGTNNNPKDCLTAVLIIVLRYRNNLFHGIKWDYELSNQLENFTHANNVIKKTLDRYGCLAGS
jgi:hypothetical protein